MTQTKEQIEAEYYKIEDLAWAEKERKLNNLKKVLK